MAIGKSKHFLLFQGCRLNHQLQQEIEDGLNFHLLRTPLLYLCFISSRVDVWLFWNK